MKVKVKVYKTRARSNPWTWQLVAGNGKIIGNAAENFDSPGNAKRAAVMIAKAMQCQVIYQSDNPEEDTITIYTPPPANVVAINPVARSVHPDRTAAEAAAGVRHTESTVAPEQFPGRAPVPQSQFPGPRGKERIVPLVSDDSDDAAP